MGGRFQRIGSFFLLGIGLAAAFFYLYLRMEGVITRRWLPTLLLALLLVAEGLGGG